MPQCTYLHKAPNGVHEYCLSIPAELRPGFDGRREIAHTLRTKDRDTAKTLILGHASATMAPLDDARAPWDWEREQAVLVAADTD